MKPFEKTPNQTPPPHDGDDVVVVLSNNSTAETSLWQRRRAWMQKESFCSFVVDLNNPINDNNDSFGRGV
jgi:hypothetical protein